MNVREFAEMLLKLPDQEAIVQVVEVMNGANIGFENFTTNPDDQFIEYVEADEDAGKVSYLQLGYYW